MEPGFGQNLEGNIISGNLSLIQQSFPSLQDGSLEIAGSLLADHIYEYNNNSQGININNVIITQACGGNVYIPYSVPSKLNSAALIIDGGITIRNTTDVTSLTSGGGLTNFGGLSVIGHSIFGNDLDIDINRIRNLNDPVLDLDAVNKRYLMDTLYSYGSYEPGQIIIGNSFNQSIKGYDAFTYNPSSGTLSFSGGSVFAGPVSVENNIISNVADPILSQDAVNKRYIDDSFFTCEPINNTEYEKGLVLTSENTSTDILDLVFDSNIVQVFEVKVYTYCYNQETSLHILRGMYNSITERWILNDTALSNKNVRPTVTYSINTFLGIGTVQYTATMLPCYIRYRISYSSNFNQIGSNVLELFNLNQFEDTGISLSNLVYIYRIGILLTRNSTVSFVLMTVFQTNSGWNFVYDSYGSFPGLNFDIQGNDIYYINNIPGTAFISWEIKILNALPNSQTINTNSSTVINGMLLDTRVSRTYTIYFHVSDTIGNVFVYILNAWFTERSWYINTESISGNYSISFTPSPVDSDTAVLLCTNNTGYTCTIRVHSELVLQTNPICVTKGGTGNNDFIPYSVLLGNGTDRLQSSKLIFYEDQLIIDEFSSIVIRNTGDSYTNYGSSYVNGKLQVESGIFNMFVTTGNQILISNTEHGYTGYPEFTFGEDGLNLHDNLIRGIQDPILPQDAVNKRVLEQRVSNYGSFSSGQVLVSNSAGNGISGYNAFTFDNFTNRLSISGSVYGRGIFNGNVTIGNQLLISDTSVGYNSCSNLFIDSISTLHVPAGISLSSFGRISNVQNPVSTLDAANKDYVDNLLSNPSFYGNSSVFEVSNVLDNNGLYNDTGFEIASGICAAVITIDSRDYTQSNTCNFLYILSIYKDIISDTWSMNTRTVKNSKRNKLYFRIQDNKLQILISETGTLDSNSPADPVFSMYIKIRMMDHLDQDDITFRNIQSTITNYHVSINDIVIPGNAVAYKYMFNTLGIQFLYAFKNLYDGTWSFGSVNYSNNNNVQFHVNTLSGIVQYTANTVHDILYETSTDTLLSNPLTALTVNTETVLTSIKNINSVYVLLFVQFSTYSVFYEISGIRDELGNMILNYSNYGRPSAFDIYVNTDFLVCKTQSNASISTYISVPPYFSPLSVSKGGSGKIEYIPGAALFGNGQDPIYESRDIILSGNTLGISDSISFNIGNYNLRSGTIDLENNRLFPYPVLSFENMMCIELSITVIIITVLGSLRQLQNIRAVKSIDNIWSIDTKKLGDDTGIEFDMNTMDELEYTSTFISDYVSCKIRYYFTTT